MQFGDPLDYARMLSGRNGAPMWYIDKHPMRVFKWTPDFDTFFELPIAAVWCNLIGLPIHLFEHSALFAIGNLLGNPIQADHATATRSRLSYARICVEIGISTPPRGEIVLEVLGKEVRQTITWDRIPLYCCVCKHVGHVKDTCYAAGKKAKLPKKDYTVENAARQSYQATHPNQAWRPRNMEKGIIYANDFGPLGNEEGEKEREDRDGQSSCQHPRRENSDKEGFQKVRRRKSKNNYHPLPPRQSTRIEDLTSLAMDESKERVFVPCLEIGPSSGWGYLKNRGEDSHTQTMGEISKPKYYRMRPNDAFDTEELEADGEMDMEGETEGNKTRGQDSAFTPDPT